jgi:hypothetical protein
LPWLNGDRGRFRCFSVTYFAILCYHLSNRYRFFYIRLVSSGRKEQGTNVFKSRFISLPELHKQ